MDFHPLYKITVGASLLGNEVQPAVFNRNMRFGDGASEVMSDDLCTPALLSLNRDVAIAIRHNRKSGAMCDGDISIQEEGGADVQRSSLITSEAPSPNLMFLLKTAG